MEDAAAVGKIMLDCGMPVWGVAPYGSAAPRLIPCGGLRRLPEGARSIVVALFPYYCGQKRGEVSRYAAGADYHGVAGEMLSKAAELLRRRFPNRRFEPFCDASPIPEVEAARLAGLGAVGKNGLLISPRYGSYVFIGELVTDLELEASSTPGGTCAGCGKCAEACPGGALREKFNCGRCVSHLTQRKGELSPEERELIRTAGYLWGCDLCQEVCPLNRKIEMTPIEAFKKDLVDTFSREELENDGFKSRNAGRAFMWRGKAVLLRNHGILHGEPENNI